MRGEKNLERFEQSRRLSGAFEERLDLVLMAVGHGGNDGLLVFEIAVDEADADSGLGADVVHAGLVEAAFGEADHGGVEDLLAAIERWDLMGAGTLRVHNE